VELVIFLLIAPFCLVSIICGLVLLASPRVSTRLQVFTTIVLGLATIIMISVTYIPAKDLLYYDQYHPGQLEWQLQESLRNDAIKMLNRNAVFVGVITAIDSLFIFYLRRKSAILSLNSK